MANRVGSPRNLVAALALGWLALLGGCRTRLLDSPDDAGPVMSDDCPTHAPDAGAARCPRCVLDFLDVLPAATGASFVVGDFNGDGTPDFVASTGNDVSILIGAGDGSFRSSSLGVNGEAVAAADLDGDGKLDLVVSASQLVTDVDAGTFTFHAALDVLRGRGDGTFDAAPSFPIDTEVLAMVAADLDGDGRRDLASVERRPGDSGTALVLRRGTGGGAFAPAEPVPLPRDDAAALAAADFDGDCRTDLALAFGAGYVGVVVNRADRAFQLANVLPVRNGPFALATGDLDRDGHLDLVVGDTAFPDNARVELLLGNGDGTLQPASSRQSGFQSTSVAIADMNGDGNLDVVLGTAPANGTGPDRSLWMLLGDGHGELGDPIAFGPYRAISQVAVADFNRDGRPDVLFTGHVLLNATR